MSDPSKAAGDDLPYSAAGKSSPWLIAIIVSIATFMEVLDSTIANVSLRHMAGSLAAGQDESTYILTSYLVSNAIVVPISGWLANVVGRKRFYMICVAIFTVASVLCATAETLPQMLVWRVLQGAGGGGLAPVEQSIFADTFPLRQRAASFALYGFTVILAPAVGPVLGGWLTDSFSWHWVFLINLPVGMLSLTLVALFVVDPPPLLERRRKLLAQGLRIDYVGFVLVVLAFGSLQIVLDRFEREGGWGTPFVNLFGSIFLVSMIAMIVWEWNHDQPLIDLRLFRAPGFAASNVALVALGFVLMASTQLLPQMAQSLMGYDALTAGLTLSAAGVLTIFVMPLAGVLTGRVFQPKYLACAAFLGTAGSLWYATGLTQAVGFWNISIIRMIQALFLPFLFIPLMSISLVGVKPEQNANASAITNMTRNVGGSIGISFATTLLAYRNQFHHARMAEHVTPYTGYGAGTNLMSIERVLQDQANTLSYLDVFWAVMLVSLAAAIVTLLLPRMRKGAVAGH